MTEPIQLTRYRITVLLVDDQQMIGEAVRRMLVSEDDIDFHYCQDPTQAIRTANEIRPTVILQDLVMPEMEGLRLVRYIRANPTTRETPLIVLSSEEEPRKKAEAFALGASDYMVKLPDRLEVIARIRYHSRGYINLLERNEAYNALLESQRQLEIRNRFIRKTFGRYLSEDVVDSILESPDGAKLGGEKRWITILMSDLRGFTSISESLKAEHVVSIINNYLAVMTEIILKYQGTIDEFIGDAILVIFGAPIQRDDDAERAVACALEMQLATEKVNRANREAGFPDVAQGIGINTGDAVVGNIGSEKRSKYGVVGRNINLTSRIESYTVGGQTLISQSTKDACGELLRIDDTLEIMPKGIADPITVYEVGGIGGNFNLYLSEKQTVDLPELVPPIAIRFSLVEGKYASRNVHEGHVIRLNPVMAEVKSEARADRLANLRIILNDVDDEEITRNLYAKVIQTFPDQPSVFRIQFTSLPPEARTYLEWIMEEKV